MSVFFTEPIHVTRKRGVGLNGGYDPITGLWVSESPEPPAEILQLNVQPITGKELESLRMGRENLGKVKIYSDYNIVLNISTEGTINSGDYIEWKGKKYEVISEEEHENEEFLEISHHKYIGELRE